MKKQSNFASDTEFKKRFPSEEKCLDYLVSLRWPNGYECPRCHAKKAWEVRSYKYKCRYCGYQTTATAGTLFHQTHLSMLQWFQAIWYMSEKGRAVTATELRAVLSLGSKRTAQIMVNKIRPMLFTQDSSIADRKLKGAIELSIVRPWEREDFSCIFTAVEFGNRQFGNIRISKVPYNKEGYRDFIQKNIKQGSVIKRQVGHHKVACNVEGYTLSTRNIEHFQAIHAQKIYQDFKKYEEKISAGNSRPLEDIIEMYNRYWNTPSEALNFDEIMENILFSNY